jgi:hypothetical protein
MHTPPPDGNSGGDVVLFVGGYVWVGVLVGQGGEAMVWGCAWVGVFWDALAQVVEVTGEDYGFLYEKVSNVRRALAVLLGCVCGCCVCVGVHR